MCFYTIFHFFVFLVFSFFLFFVFFFNFSYFFHFFSFKWREKFMVFCVPQVPTFVLFPWIFTLVLSFCCAIKISIFFFFLVFSFFLFFVFFLIFLIFFHFYSFKWWEKFMVFCVSQVPTFVLFPWIFTLVLSFCCATKVSLFLLFILA